MKRLPLRAILPLSVLIAGAALPTAAQAPADNRAILLAMAMNAKQVVEYEWKQRITVVRKGKPSEPIVDQIRFDSNKQMQRTTISAPEPQARGGIRGRVASGVRENVKDVMELVGRYNKPQQMKATVEKARISKQAGAAGPVLRLDSNDVLQPGDSVTIFVNPVTHLASHIDIRTAENGAPVTVAQDYGPANGGPNMMTRMNVSEPGKGLVIDVDSYDFRRQAPGA